MHIKFLVEDQSGKKALEILIPKILPPDVTFRITSYNGCGRIPPNMKDVADPSKRILLNSLPKLLKGHGRTFQGYGPGYSAAVVVVCDLDRRNRDEFLSELNEVLNACNPAPETRFCLAIEEVEAWFLGDVPAILKAYPRANQRVLASYVNDSICGTWEKLSEAVDPGGPSQQGSGRKMRWASEIPLHMDIEANQSPSFCSFRDEIRALIGS